MSRTGPGDHLNPVRGRVFTDLRKRPTAVLAVTTEAGDVEIRDGFLIAGRVLLVPNNDSTVKYEPGSRVTAYLQDGDRMIPTPGLPPHVNRKSSVGGNEWIIRDVARTAGGSEVLIWEGDGYEWAGGQFRKTFSLGITDRYNHASAVPAGADGFFYLSGRRLFEARRGADPISHAARWTNVMVVQPGPGGGLLLMEGDNKDGDVGKLYFPAEGTFAHIEPELLGDHDLYDFLTWSEPADRVVASNFHRLYAVPTAVVLGLPRYRVSTGRRAKG